MFFGTETVKWCYASLSTFQDVITGKSKIIKIPRPTAEEQLAIDYARACGCKWIAKDEDGIVNAFAKKPKKGNHCWLQNDNIYITINRRIPFSFLHFEDKEPYYIGQDKSEQNKYCGS